MQTPVSLRNIPLEILFATVVGACHLLVYVINRHDEIRPVVVRIGNAVRAGPSRCGAGVGSLVFNIRLSLVVTLPKVQAGVVH